MAHRTDFMVFADIEATGAEDDAEIIEVGMVAVTLPDYRETDSFSAIIQPSPEKWDAMLPVVVAMHAKSGLTADIVGGHGYATVLEVEALALTWLREKIGKNTDHVLLGGSGIDHYDRRYLQRDMPRLMKRFTFFSRDAGQMRRAFRDAGIPWLAGATDENKAHRALDDARLHAREYAYAIETLRGHPLAGTAEEEASK